MNLERFDEALDKAKDMTLRLNDSEMSDVAMQIIHAIDLLADEVVKQSTPTKLTNQ